MLRQLVDGPLSDDSLICTAFIAVEGQAALPVLANEEQAEDGLQALAAAACQEGVARARAAAKSVLARRRESLVLWSAYAQFEARVGNRKACILHWQCIMSHTGLCHTLIPTASCCAAGCLLEHSMACMHFLVTCMAQCSQG